ncbi:MAG: AI-2E family transporter [Bacteroidota bacterium]|nr:AI-2E family transporter [Bacteroidota bacterium]
MKELYERYKLFFIILITVAIGFLAWYFSTIIIVVLIAGVVSIIGFPLVDLLDKIRIGKIHFPHILSVFITLILLVAIFFGLFSFFIPLVAEETGLISSIDWDKLGQYYQSDIQWIQHRLIDFGIIHRHDTFQSLLKANFTRIVDFNKFSDILGSIISYTVSFFFNLFSIVFISFFFLLDKNLLPRFILLIIPKKYHEKTKNVMSKSKKLLTRYFIGLIIDILVMIASYAIALSIVGVKGALVIAFFGGIVNMIPYIGPIVATVTGVLLAVTGVISEGMYMQIAPVAIKTLIAIVVVILLDNVLYQPWIYGKSVKAHPIEIFLVIIAAASIGGIPGMIIAVPAYAFLRIVAVEFFDQFRVVQQISQKT